MKTILSSDTMDIPNGIKIKVKDKVIEVEGPRGKLSRNFKHLNLDFQLITDEATGNKKFKVDAWFGSRKTTAAIRTALSHVQNLINGVTKGYRYKMRFVYAHFPINASITGSGTAIEIRNFLGEKKASSMAVVSLLRAAWIAATLPIAAASIPSSKINAFHHLMLQLVGRGKIMDSSARASSMAVVSLLRAAWIAVTLPIAAASIPSSKINAFRHLMLQLAGRGKIMDSSARKLSVPQKYFCHFYVLGAIWTGFLLVATWLYAYETAPIVSESSLYSSLASQLTGVSYHFSLHKSGDYKYGIWKSVFLLLLMEAQLLRRLFESIHIFKYNPSARMHIAGYLTGLFFYTAAPLSLCSTFAIEVFKNVINLTAEFVVKGKDRMQVQEFDFWGHVIPLLHLRWFAWIGGVVFFWGWIHQRRCHAILGSLRENGHKVDDYAIPQGDWFEYVSSPHYLAEIVIYAGLVIASGFSDITIWLAFGFVVANLALVAGETHRWYLRKFDNYPINRCAIIPFVY